MTAHPVTFAFVHKLAGLHRRSADVAGFAILLMMLAGAADVIATNLNLLGLRSRPIPSTNEFMATMMVAAVFLAMSQAQQRRGHIQLDAVSMFGRRIGLQLEPIHHLLHGLLYGSIAWFGWAAAAHALATGEFAAGVINFPVWPARIALAIGATAMTAQCIIDLLSVFDPRFRAYPADGLPPAQH